jgi:hypothetical protein
MTTEHVTKADPYLKTDEELLQIVIQRVSLNSSETGVTDLIIVEGAIGALFVGQRYGLRILRILHSGKTLGQYEKFLGASFEDLIPQHGIFIDRSVAWWISTTSKKYWDVVYRRFKIEGDQRRGIVDSASQVR